MKYPFTPEVLDAMPEPLAELFRKLEADLLEEICSRLRIADNINEVSVAAIKALRSHGVTLSEIKRAIRKATDTGVDELDKLLDDVVARNQRYHTELIDLAKVTQPKVLVDNRTIDAIKAQTLEEFRNITQSMGFMVTQGARRAVLPHGKEYQWALDNAVLQMESGVTGYTGAVARAVKELADSGIKTVSYESGHVDQVDVAVRRAVLTGVGQLCAKYTERSAEWLGTRYYEISAHVGARDTGTKWQNHKAWQGKVYSTEDNDKYPSIYEVCGLGLVDGLEGANCRHIRFPFIDGVSERTYTDEQLANIDPPPFEYQGKTYTAYEATQQQRKIERTVRKLKREQAAYKAAGLTEEATATGARIRRLNAEYTKFSKAAGLPEQRERMKVVPINDPKQEWKSPSTSAIMAPSGATRVFVKNSELKNGLPISGEANTIVDKTDDSGKVLQRRIYGADGKAKIDYDTSDHKRPDIHPMGAHKHVFDYSRKRSRGVAEALSEQELEQNRDIIKRGVNYSDIE